MIFWLYFVERCISCDPYCYACLALSGNCLHGVTIGTQDAWTDLIGHGNADVQLRCWSNTRGLTIYVEDNMNTAMTDPCSCCMYCCLCVPLSINLGGDCTAYCLTGCLYHACFRTSDGFGMLEARPLLTQIIN